MPEVGTDRRAAAPPAATYLVPIAGPTIEPLSLLPRDDRPQGLTLGRHASCDLTLPASAESVSRYHVRFRYDDGSRRWRVADLGSRWGSFLNGVRLSPNVELPLHDGDLLRINPWTFALGGEPRRRRGLQTMDDGNSTMVRTLAGAAASAPLKNAHEDMLALLLEAAAAIHDAPDETQLAERLLDAAVRGSGLPNAAVLRPVDTDGRVEILASRLPSAKDGSGSGFNFSRSLLNAAADGHVAELSLTGSADGDTPISHSIVQMNISAALCVPLMLGPAPAAFLYLDARANRAAHAAFAPGLRPQASAFCAALGRLAGLALANLKRVDVERRQAMIEHDLNAAAAAQRWVLPKRETKVGPFIITGESRPGRYVGGDFFDVIELEDGRLAVSLGDVSGKGVEASVLMTATQGFLHAALQLHGEPARAVSAANAFVAPRRPDCRFVTLWLAVLDLRSQTLTYVDAGHGYGALFDESNNYIELRSGGGPPLGVADEYKYTVETVPLPAHGKLAIVSDGFVEQASPTPDTLGGRNDFKMAGVCQCLATPNDDDVAALFGAIFAHAGSSQLADDATAVCVKW